MEHDAQMLKKSHDFVMDSEELFCYLSDKVIFLERGHVAGKEEIASSEDAFFIYKHLADYHLQVLKRQSKCEFFYWKSLGIFFVLSLAFFILKDHGFVFSPFLGIVLSGVGIFLVLLQNIRMDFEYGIQAASYVQQGLSIEKTFKDRPRIFQIFEDNKLLTYKGNLISRLFPMGLIVLGTTTAGVLLSLKVGVWLALGAALISIIAIYAGVRSYLKVIRKIIFGS